MEPPAAAVRRRRDLLLEQGELWGGPRDAAGEDLLAEETTETASVPVARVADELDAFREAPRLQRPDTVSAYRVRAAGSHLVSIAKFLQVNDAVHGMKVAGMDLPRGRFAARFSLWKGNPVGTPFLMGC